MKLPSVTVLLVGLCLVSVMGAPATAYDRPTLRVVLSVTSEGSRNEIINHAEAALQRIGDVELVERDDGAYHVVYLTHGRTTTARVRTGHVISSVVTYLPSADAEDGSGDHGELYRYSELFWGGEDLRTQIDRAVLSIDRKVFEPVRQRAREGGR